MTEDLKIETFARTMRERIKRGDFGTSGRLPSVTQLAKDYQMSRTTVNQSLALLRSEGLIYVKDTSYFVTQPMLLIEGAPNFDRYLEKQGLQPAFETIGTPELITMPDDIASMFGVPQGLQVIHRMRKQGTSEVPLRIEENWYPADLAIPFLEVMKADSNINVAREIRLSTGQAITRIKEYTIARHPTQEEAKILEIARTSPVLEARRNFVTSEDRTIIYNRTIMVAAFFMMYHDYPTSWQKAQE